MPEDYEVGYGKPPKHTRFRKGKSGNPKGRPKGHKNFKSDLLSTLRAPVQVTEKGKQKKISTQKAVLLRLREKALGGDRGSMDKLIDLARAMNDEEFNEAVAEPLSSSDRAILDGYLERQRSDASARSDAKIEEPADTEVDDDDWLR